MGRCSAVVVTLEKAPLLRVKTEMEAGIEGGRLGGEFLAGDGAPFVDKLGGSVGRIVARSGA